MSDNFLHMTERIARAAALHPWRTIIAWLAAIVLAFAAIVAFLGDGLSTEEALTNNPESEQAADVIGAHFPPREFTTELVIIRHDGLRRGDPAFDRRLDELAQTALTSPFIDFVGEPQVAPDGHAVLVPIRLARDPEESVERVIEIVRAEDGRGGFQVAMTGEFTTDHDFNELSQRDLEEGELRFGLPAALVVLVLVFGALVASVVPLVLAMVSIAVGLGLVAVVTTGFELSVFVVNMLTGMGLALGIDYALFVVSRFREERAAGKEKIDAIAASGATASRAVLFSGSAFVLAMLGLLLVQSTIMRSLAAGAILVGIVSVVAALTLLPALLGLLGDRVNRLHVPIFGREQGESRLWAAVVRRVLARPVLSLSLAVALLLGAAAPALTMEIGAAGIGTLPDNLVSKQGFNALERSFPAAGADPAEIAIDAPLS
ncbi:MAG TPA: MMPL family transporter, partial [Candidatus Limnocylindrales bacterium]|nr:MMPL family transporter [Candidatus Limnocylindrales bacterium]